ncbi:n-terminal domain protein [Ichthyophthirius multifiliis]|uniref:N-terminal domain protein n=1 Tax=Ichthyophthirius multifiliis TaxID=5932 RepID=G0QTP6_ICHMU|nr:n-terminal domain protein [Ichthyophthirius multifiliis]EGR31419.1 n-terminal domain protein [Ichthyophthirius multifiliis]|eukprot:XP_004034905.1 n-terminal domain protein [Ichthyophthirius multifiliis]
MKKLNEHNLIYSDQLNKIISKLLNRFERNKTWSDLNNWLSKAIIALKENPSPFINEKIQFCKRLAQCLNPQLPQSIHQETLKIYEQIFENMKQISEGDIQEYQRIFCQDLGLYSVGLFPFFQYSQLQLKYLFIDIIEYYYVPVGRELIPCIPGLILCLLPGFEENNKEIKLKIKNCLLLLMKACGRKYFYGGFWMAIKRVQKETFSKQEIEEQQEQQEQEINNKPRDSDNLEVYIFQSKLHNKNYQQNIIHNDLIIYESEIKKKQQKIIENEEEEVQINSFQENIYRNNRKELLYIEKGIDDNTLYNKYPNKGCLVLNVILSCLEDKDVFVKRNILDLLIHYIPLNNNNVQILSFEEKTILCEGVLRLFAKRDISLIHKISFWMFGKPDLDEKYNYQPETIQIIKNALNNIFLTNKNEKIKPLKMLQNLFLEHEALIQFTLGEISLNLIQFIQKAYEKNKEEEEKNIQRLIEIIGQNIYLFFNCLCDFLNNEILWESPQNMDEDSFKENIIKLLIFSFQKILLNLKDEILLQKLINMNLDQVTFSLQTVPEQLIHERKQVEVGVKFINHLLFAKKQFSDDQVIYLDNFYIFFQKYTKKPEDIKPQKHQLFKLICENVYLIQSQIPKNNSQYLALLQKCITLTHTTISLISIEYTTKILQKVQNNPKQNFLEKLWGMLDNQNAQKITQLIEQLSQYFPSEIEKTIQNSFQVLTISEKEHSIHRFSLFWKLLGQKTQLNLTQSILQIINNLENENPLLRHAAKGWIQDSEVNLYLIIDQLILYLVEINDNYIYEGEKKNAFYYIKTFDVQKANFIFRKLHILCKSACDIFFKYIISTYISPQILQIVGKNQLRTTYLTFLKNLSLKFITVTALESLSSKFFHENQAVNASSAELLELLLVYTNEEDIQIEKLLEEIIQIFTLNIQKEEYVMQLQTLNLLKVILFRKNVPNYVLQQIFEQSSFFSALFQGLQSSLVNVRSQYICFLNTLMPFLCQKIENQNFLGDIVMKCIFSYSQIIDNYKQKYEAIFALKNILQTFLKIQDLNDNQVIEMPSSNLNGGFFSYIFGLQGEKKIQFEHFEIVCENIFGQIQFIIDLLVKNWVTQASFPFSFNNQGVQEYQYDKFFAFNQKFKEIKETFLKQKRKIADFSIIKGLMIAYPQQIVNIFTVLWVNNIQNGQYLQNIIEIILLLQINPRIYLEYFIQVNYFGLLKQFYKQKKVRTTPEIGQIESYLLYFLYSYLLYSYLDSNSLKKDNLLTFWHTILKVLFFFDSSTHPNVNLFYIEILFLLSNKYVPKEILSDSRINKSLHDQINQKLIFLSNYVINNQNLQLQNDLEELIFPYSPSLQQEILKIQSSIIVQNDENQQDQLQNKLEKQNETFFKKQEKKLAILYVLDHLALNLLQNTYKPERQDRIIIRIKECFEPLNILFNEKAQFQSKIVEFASKFLYNLVNNQSLVKEFKKNILEIFNQDNFFSCSKRTLQYWGEIINIIINTEKNDLFMNYLNKVTLNSSFFSKEEKENKKRIKAFKRVCFLIFYGKKDQYLEKLSNLLDKISEVIKNSESIHPQLLILILFAFRIIIIRLSTSNMNQLFINIWPMLLGLLIQISKNSKNINLLLAGLKIIEIFSIVKVDQFYLHQWIFFYDYFGIQLNDNNSLVNDNKSTSNNDILSVLNNSQEQQDIISQENQQVPQQENVIITNSKVENQIQLYQLCKKLSQSIIDFNEIRSETLLDEVESMIEDDFINLDEQILKI